MKKQILLLVTCILMVFMTVGCMRIEQDCVIGEDNHFKMTLNLSINLDKFADAYIAYAKESGAEEEYSKQQIIDEVQAGADGTYKVENGYIVYPEEVFDYSEEEVKSMMPDIIANKDKFVKGTDYTAFIESLLGTDASDPVFPSDLDFSEEELKEMIEYTKLTVTFPGAITVTNGTKVNDNTVTWDSADNGKALYAYTVPLAEGDVETVVASDLNTIKKQMAEAVKEMEEDNKDTKKPVIAGVKNKKSYKKKATIYVKDNTSLKSVKVNGKKVKLTKVKKGKYKGYYKFTLKKKGSHKIVATDTSGNKRSIKIKIKK